LIEFMGKCAERGIGVALSTWFREEASERCQDIYSPVRMAAVWKAVLDHIRNEGLLDSVIVNYKDGPMLDWGWVKEICAHGVESAVRTGAWKAVCTSNFCGPQFVGMWRDIGWHQTLTRRIRGQA